MSSGSVDPGPLGDSAPPIGPAHRRRPASGRGPALGRSRRLLGRAADPPAGRIGPAQPPAPRRHDQRLPPRGRRRQRPVHHPVLRVRTRGLVPIGCGHGGPCHPARGSSPPSLRLGRSGADDRRPRLAHLRCRSLLRPPAAVAVGQWGVGPGPGLVGRGHRLLAGVGHPSPVVERGRRRPRRFERFRGRSGHRPSRRGRGTVGLGIPPRAVVRPPRSDERDRLVHLAPSSPDQAALAAPAPLDGADGCPPAAGVVGGTGSGCWPRPIPGC